MSGLTIFRRLNRAEIAGETRRQELGRFLRDRRESLSPELVGISSQRGRRTPGLRREEVAFLADIGVKWYARLEAGDEIHPSAATLRGIAAALRLSSAEVEYMLDLSGLGQPVIDATDLEMMPPPLSALCDKSYGVSVSICDRILTPIRWNDIADALYRHSAFENPVERNGLVRALFDPYFISFLGAELESHVFNAVGMFRFNHSSPSPSPFTGDVYERVRDHALFQRAWQQRVVSNELTSSRITVRVHPLIGRLSLYAIDFNMATRSDLFMRVMVPSDDETAAKFARLKQSSLPARRATERGSTWEGDLSTRL